MSSQSIHVVRESLESSTGQVGQAGKISDEEFLRSLRVMDEERVGRLEKSETKDLLISLGLIHWDASVQLCQWPEFDSHTLLIDSAPLPSSWPSSFATHTTGAPITHSLPQGLAASTDSPILSRSAFERLIQEEISMFSPNQLIPKELKLFENLKMQGIFSPEIPKDQMIYREIRWQGICQNLGKPGNSFLEPLTDSQKINLATNLKAHLLHHFINHYNHRSAEFNPENNNSHHPFSVDQTHSNDTLEHFSTSPKNPKVRVFSGGALKMSMMKKSDFQDELFGNTKSNERISPTVQAFKEALINRRKQYSKSLNDGHFFSRRKSFQLSNVDLQIPKNQIESVLIQAIDFNQSSFFYLTKPQMKVCLAALGESGDSVHHSGSQSSSMNMTDIVSSLVGVLVDRLWNIEWLSNISDDALSSSEDDASTILANFSKIKDRKKSLKVNDFVTKCAEFLSPREMSFMVFSFPDEQNSDFWKFLQESAEFISLARKSPIYKSIMTEHGNLYSSSYPVTAADLINASNPKP